MERCVTITSCIRQWFIFHLSIPLQFLLSRVCCMESVGWFLFISTIRLQSVRQCWLIDCTMTGTGVGRWGGNRGTNFCSFTLRGSEGRWGEGGCLSGVVITLPIESLSSWLFSIDQSVWRGLVRGTFLSISQALEHWGIGQWLEV